MTCFKHSHDERREIIIGHSAQQDLILVSFTAVDDRVRLLSARKVTRKERKDYEEKHRFVLEALKISQS